MSLIGNRRPESRQAPLSCRLARLRVRLPGAWFVSAHDPRDVALIRDRIVGIFEATYVEDELLIPYDRQAVLSEMHDAGRVAAERYDDSGVIVTYRAEPQTIARFKSKLTR